MEVKEAYKFCPRCGAKFADKKLHFLQCSACGLHFYLNPKPVQSVILVNNKSEYLFVVRAVEPRKGYLDFPGGFVDEDEDFEASVKREIKEELGIEISALEYLNTTIDRYLFEDINYKVAGITYIGKLPKNAVIKPADDVSGVEFYKLEDVPTERLAWPSIHRMITDLKNKLE